MSYLINELGLSGRLQYFHINTNARDFHREQAAVIRLRHVSRALDLPTEMTVLTALAPANVAAFGGTTLEGEQWMVAIDRAPASVGDLLDYFDERGERLHTQRDTSTKILLTDEQLRAIYADAGAGPDAEQIGFTSLLIGLQAEAFGYPSGDVVNNMNAQCAFPADANHDCEGSFFGDMGAGWVNRGPNGYAPDNSADDDGAPSPGGVPAPLMRPTEGQTKEEFAQDVVDTFQEFIDDVNNAIESSRTTEQRDRDDAFGRWRHEQNVWRAERDKADQSDAEDGRGAP